MMTLRGVSWMFSRLMHGFLAENDLKAWARRQQRFLSTAKVTALSNWKDAYLLWRSRSEGMLAFPDSDTHLVPKKFCFRLAWRKMANEVDQNLHIEGTWATFPSSESSLFSISRRCRKIVKWICMVMMKLHTFWHFQENARLNKRHALAVYSSIWGEGMDGFPMIYHALLWCFLPSPQLTPYRSWFGNSLLHYASRILRYLASPKIYFDGSLLSHHSIRRQLSPAIIGWPAQGRCIPPAPPKPIIGRIVPSGLSRIGCPSMVNMLDNFIADRRTSARGQ